MTKHPAACPFCGGTTVNSVEPDIRLRNAVLNDDGSINISDSVEDGQDWTHGDALFCHGCSSTYKLDDDIIRHYTTVKDDVYDGVTVPSIAEDDATFLVAGWWWSPRDLEVAYQ